LFIIFPSVVSYVKPRLVKTSLFFVPDQITLCLHQPSVFYDSFFPSIKPPWSFRAHDLFSTYFFPETHLSFEAQSYSRYSCSSATLFRPLSAENQVMKPVVSYAFFPAPPIFKYPNSSSPSSPSDSPLQWFFPKLSFPNLSPENNAQASTGPLVLYPVLLTCTDPASHEERPIQLRFLSFIPYKNRSRTQVHSIATYSYPLRRRPLPTGSSLSVFPTSYRGLLTISVPPSYQVL